MVEKDKAHSRVTRVLKAERNEGTSPTLRAVEAECKRLREELDVAQREYRELKKTHGAFVGRLIAHYADEHGLVRENEAAEQLMRDFLPDVRFAGVRDDTTHRGMKDVEGVRRIQQARRRADGAPRDGQRVIG